MNYFRKGDKEVLGKVNFENSPRIELDEAVFLESKPYIERTFKYN